MSTDTDTLDPWAEEDERLGYDADHRDSSQYCRHGTFIGSWWGPDYLCGWCESGEEPPTPAEARAIALDWCDHQAAKFDDTVAAITSDEVLVSKISFGRICQLLADLAELNPDWEKAWRTYNQYGLVTSLPDC